MNIIKIELCVLKDIVNANGVLIDHKDDLRDVVVFDSDVADFDDVIKAAEARYLETYFAEAHYGVDFDIVNQAEICAKLHD